MKYVLVSHKIYRALNVTLVQRGYLSVMHRVISKSTFTDDVILVRVDGRDYEVLLKVLNDSIDYPDIQSDSEEMDTLKQAHLQVMNNVVPEYALEDWKEEKDNG